MKTWLLEFKCCSDSKHPVGKLCIDDVIRVINELAKENIVLLYCDGNSTNQTLDAFCKNEFCTILIQYTKSLLTLDIHQSEKKGAFSERDIDDMRSMVYNLDWIVKSNTLEYKRLPAITRGSKFSCYDVGVNGKLFEYDFSEVVFDQNSNYQNIRIMKSKQYGNCLFLDNDLNLSESDLAYTIAITGSGEENFEGKDILVLGAGDGGILNYLINSDKKPGMVTMVEIDQMVIDAAKLHLRGICGNIFDPSVDDTHFKIIVDDCIPLLKNYASENKQFDFVINDLTAIPVTSTDVGSDWDLLRLLLNLSMDVLKDGGMYFAQGNATSCTDALAMYEQQIKNLHHSVAFSKESVCVPSYLEMWTFYKLWKTNY